MNVNYGVMPESFKLILGDRARMNEKSVGAMPKEISLVGGRNDTAAFSVIITADEAFALNVSEQPWFSQNSKRRNLRVSCEMPFDCEIKHIGTELCDDNYYRADSILNKSVAECESDGILSLFCEINIPVTAKRGEYCGKLLIYENYGFSRETRIGEIGVTLKVYDFLFPENKDNGFHLDLWQHPSNIARWHNVELWSDEHFAVLENYCRSLGDLGAKSVTVIASEIPWNGQGCQNEMRFRANLFEYSMISVVRKPKGLEFDYSVMQRYIDLCAEYGISECISVFGLVNVWDTAEYGGGRIAPDYPDGIRIRVFDEESGVYDYLRTAEEIDGYIRSLEKYFTDTDQIGRVRIAADEPADVGAYRKSLEHIKSVAPGFKYKTAINHAEFIREFGNDIYDFAPYISAMYSEYDALSAFKAQMPEKRFIYYVCCCPEIPNSFLRSELVDGYYIGILAAYAKMDGFLRWSYTCWTDDPNSDMRYGPFPVGDLGYVYPDRSGKPILSLRWKALFRGIRFFVLLREAEKRGLGDVLEKAYSLVLRERDIAKLYSNWEREKIMSLDYNDYREAMAVLLSALEERK